MIRTRILRAPTSDRDSTIRPRVSQMFFMNSAEHPVVAGIAGSLAGFQYKFPPLDYSRPVIAFRLWPVARMVRTEQYRETPTSAPITVNIPGNYARWFVTMRDFNGHWIVKDAPCQMFTMPINVGDVNTWPRRFNRVMIDPRQSWFTCTADNLTHLLAVELLYA